MGAIHGKGRFSCDGCDHTFSWRLDLLEHKKTCKAQNSRNRNEHKPELYLLDVCFLCGQKLIKAHSEEASFIKGNQKLYHSNKPLAEVLEIITCDKSLESHGNHMFALCKSCMTSVNKWDEIHSQLQNIASSIRSTYSTWQHKRRKKHPVSRLPTPLNRSGSVFEAELQGKLLNNISRDENTEDVKQQELGTLTLLKEEANEKTKNEDKASAAALKTYKCGCGKVAHDLDDLVDHQLRSGCKVKTNEFPCRYCEKVFNEKKLLIAHKKDCIKSSMVNGAHECDICGRRFLVRGRVETHKQAVHGIGQSEQQLCSYCGRTFSSRYNMDYHLAKEHGIGPIKKSVVCTLCNKEFTEKSSYESHVKTKHQDHRFKCEHCGKKYATQGMKNHHINEMHNDSYNYVCSICGEQFNLTFRYRYHMRKMHGKGHHPCKQCGKKFVMSSDLHRHIRGVHYGIRERKRYPCIVCGHMFPSMYKVKRHLASHRTADPKDRGSSGLESKGKSALEFHSKPDRDSPLIIQEGSLVTGSLVKGVDATTLIQRKLGTITSTLNEVIASGEPGISTSLSETPMNTSDGTSIDIHQLPTADIYTAPHITTLTPEILQGNISTDVVGAETMTVGPVSSIVVSASAVRECMSSEELQGHQAHDQLHEQNSITSCDLRRGNPLLQPVLQSSLMPMHQMIVFEESVTDPEHNTFSVQSAPNQVISVSQCTNPGQVICIPHSRTETSQADQHSQTFSVPLTPQHTQVLSQQKLPTHYEYTN